MTFNKIALVYDDNTNIFLVTITEQDIDNTDSRQVKSQITRSIDKSFEKVFSTCRW